VKEMIGMIRMKWPNIIFLNCLNKKDKLIDKSIMAISVMAIEKEEKRAKSYEIILIILVTIFALLFFARSLTVFLVLLTSGLIVGIFGWIKIKKENRKI